MSVDLKVDVVSEWIISAAETPSSLSSGLSRIGGRILPPNKLRRIDKTDFGASCLMVSLSGLGPSLTSADPNDKIET